MLYFIPFWSYFFYFCFGETLYDKIKKDLKDKSIDFSLFSYLHFKINGSFSMDSPNKTNTDSNLFLNNKIQANFLNDFYKKLTIKYFRKKHNMRIKSSFRAEFIDDVKSNLQNNKNNNAFNLDNYTYHEESNSLKLNISLSDSLDNHKIQNKTFYRFAWNYFNRLLLSQLMENLQNPLIELSSYAHCILRKYVNIETKQPCNKQSDSDEEKIMKIKNVPLSAQISSLMVSREDDEIINFHLKATHSSTLKGSVRKIRKPEARPKILTTKKSFLKKAPTKMVIRKQKTKH